jgi:hypothetical protein
MIQGAIILGIVFLILGSGVFFGKNISDSNWKTVYYTLAEQMSDMQSELNLKAEKAKGEANTLGAEITVIGEVSKVEEELMEQKVNHRVEQYLNNLLIAGMRPLREGEDSNESNYAYPLSTAPRIYNCPDPNGQFSTNLGRFEKRIIKRLIHREMKCQTRVEKTRNFLIKQENKMKELRGKYDNQASKQNSP